ncbi:MAG TPA: glucodextranase DOMON-like domain-containing protein [Streptosporangiaceae bacterium]
MTAVGALVLASATAPGSSLASASTSLTLEQAFNNVGITSSTDASSGNFDGIGDSFSASGLAEDALTPGNGLLHDGQRLSWPDVPAGQSDNVVADGQVITLSGQGSTLGIVGASAYGDATGTFTVTYADGTTSTASVTLANWTDETPASGTDFLATTAGWNPGGTVPVSLSYAAIPLTHGEPVVSVTLPTVSSGVGSGVTAMHVFDLAIGTPGAQAAGAPGGQSYYDQGRKDCVGTAADTESKVWYTVADGTLSDTYAPTIDNTDVKSLDPIVTGPGFTALQPRDMTYTVSSLGSSGMACQVIALDSAEHFAVVTDFVTSPATEAVVMQVSLVPLPGSAAGLHVYLRFNPLLNGHGGGGSDNAGGESATVVHTSRGDIPLSYSTNSFTEAVNRSYATPIYAALAASQPFAAVETGFVGATSDGLNQLDSYRRLTTKVPDADNGNVVQTVELNTPSQALRTGPSEASSAQASSAQASSAQASSAQASSAAIAAAVTRAAKLKSSLPAADVASQTVALGFGSSEHRALSAALTSSASPLSFLQAFAAYQAQWYRYDSGLNPPGGHVTPQVQNAYWLSANVIKASEDKTFLGATAASLASPWGQSVPAGTYGTDNLAPYFGSYREVFPRDAYETFTGFLADGDMTTARQMVSYWFDDMQLPNGSFPRNGLLNGKAAPDTGGLQLDETADPILAAWQAGLASDTSLYRKHIRPAADFLVANGPETSGSVERWEEQTGYSPSTMADEVAGLVAAASIAQTQGDTASARLFLATADNFRQLILATTVTTNGPLSSSPYFIRVDKTGDANDNATYTLNNGNNTPVDQRTVIDQGFLELTRLGELPASDPLVTNSLAVTANAIDVTTPSGTGVLRYNGDGYGDCEAGTVTDPVNHTTSTCTTTGAPWAPTDTGTGHPWPVLSGENGEYQVLAGDTSAEQSDLNFMLNSASGVGLVPEQVWDFADVAASPYGSDPATASIGFTDGQADGSAAPLTWAQAQLLRLIRDMATGHLVEQPSIVASRYLTNPPAVAPLSVTAPLSVSGGNVPANMERPAATVNAGSSVVTGTTTPGATVDVAVTGTAPGASAPATKIRTVTASSSSGSFSARVPLEFGTNSVEVAVTAGSATGEALFSIDNSHVPGTVVLQVPSESDGGYGPGTYAYPTAPDTFPAGAFKLSGLTVINSGSTVTFQAGIANMVSTFGSADGAQLVDLYIHNPDPGSQVQSTSAAGAWNYSIASADAWNQLIEVDGFGTDDWVTPSSTTAGLGQSSSLGTPEVTVSSLPPTSNGYTPGLVSITVPTSALGTPGPGWTFTLALAGQDGFGDDDARTFTATPGAYTFGVCSAAVAGGPNPPAICSYNPADVPIVLDTIPPSGVDVQSELNPTLPANATGVDLQGVTVP